MSTIKAVALCNFSDAGTERNFTKGEKLTLDAGTFANYLAAGLVSEETAEKPTKGAAA